MDTGDAKIWGKLDQGDGKREGEGAPPGDEIGKRVDPGRRRYTNAGVTPREWPCYLDTKGDSGGIVEWEIGSWGMRWGVGDLGGRYRGKKGLTNRSDRD